MSAAPSAPPIHDAIKPLSWILGKWRSEDGQAKYPTMESFKYGEEVEFFHVGQPNIQFSFNSWNLESKKPMHREVGFIRIQPGTNKVAIICAQNLGLAELEEGTLDGETMTTESHTVGRLSFGKEPKTKKISRVFQRRGDSLEQLVEMETHITPMQEHLRITYKKTL